MRQIFDRVFPNVGHHTIYLLRSDSDSFTPIDEVAALFLSENLSLSVPWHCRRAPHSSAQPQTNSNGYLVRSSKNLEKTFILQDA